MFLQCDLSIRCWQEAGLWHIVQGRMHRYFNIADVILDICSREVVDVVARFMMLLWGILHNRNDQVWNHCHRDAQPIYLSANVFLIEWIAAQDVRCRGSDDTDRNSSVGW